MGSTEDLINKVERAFAPEFWEVSVWPPNSHYVVGDLDIAARRRFITKIIEKYEEKKSLYRTDSEGAPAGSPVQVEHNIDWGAMMVMTPVEYTVYCTCGDVFFDASSRGAVLKAWFDHAKPYAQRGWK